MNDGSFIGDQQQRYAVEVFVQEPEAAMEAGWRPASYTNLIESAEAMAESFVLRPNWSRSRVIDREGGKRKEVKKYWKPNSTANH